MTVLLRRIWRCYCVDEWFGGWLLFAIILGAALEIIVIMDRLSAGAEWWCLRWR